MTPRVWRARPFSRQSFIFNCQTAARAGLQRHASSPVFFVEAPGRPVSRLVFSPLGKARGMARQVTQPFDLCRPVFPLENTGGASWRATRTSSRRPGLFAGVLLTAPGRAFRWPFQLAKRTIRQPSSWRAALVGHQTGSRCRPGACLRGTPAGAASLLHHQTPLDDAPR